LSGTAQIPVLRLLRSRSQASQLLQGKAHGRTVASVQRTPPTWLLSAILSF